jgi:beta-xylosidase
MAILNNIAAASLLTATLVSASTANAAFRRQNANPVINDNFPDTSWIRAEDGTWYAFATNNPGVTHVQLASAPAAAGPWTVLQRDTLLKVEAWCNGIEVRAPDVRQVADGSYVLYYAGSPYGPDALHGHGDFSQSRRTLSSSSCSLRL